MEVAAETKIVNPQVPEGVHVTKQEAERAKRSRGRPSKPFISELPPPPKFEISEPSHLFTYLKSIPIEKLKRVLLVFYRYHPVVDATEGGTRDKYLDKVSGENHPFTDDDWENQVLHRYGSGTYGCYLNEMNRTICRCLRIETRWDLENYPPIIDTQWLDQDHPQNRAYIQFLRGRGIKLPTQKDQQEVQEDMQLAETNSKLIDTLIARTTPVPQIRQDTVTERIALETAKAGIEMATDQAKQIMASNVRESNPLELVNSVITIADKMTSKGSGADETTKLIMHSMAEDRKEARERAQRAEERNEKLMDRMLTQTPAKTGTDALKETLELMAMIKAALGSEEKESSESGNSGGSIVKELVANAPEIMKMGVGLWGQFNQSLVTVARMKEIEAMRAAGQAPVMPVPSPQVQPPPQPQAVPPQHPNGVIQPNPAPNGNAGMSEAELQAAQAERMQYAQYHPFIAEIAEPLINHLNGKNPQTNKPFDGYDFAEWFIAGKGQLGYQTVKAVGPDVLLGAVKSYTPIWNVIGGIEPKVKEFLGQFLTYEEMMKDLDDSEDDGDGDDEGEEQK